MNPAHVLATAAYLQKFANALADRKGRTGILRLFKDKARTGGLSIGRLVRHLGQYGVTRESVIAAICSLGPIAGGGRLPYVLIITGERIAADKARSDAQTLLNRDEQRAFYLSLFSEAGIEISADTLPALDLNETAH